MVAWSGMWQALRNVHLTWPLGELCLLSTLWSDSSSVWRLLSCKTRGYFWRCHFTDVLYFPAANLRSGNHDFELHFPCIRAEPCNFARSDLQMKVILYCLAWFKRYHGGRLYSSCGCWWGSVPAGLCSPRPPAWRGGVERVLEINGWGQLRKRMTGVRALSLECLHLPGSSAFNH